MNHLSKITMVAALLLLAAPVQAQDGNDSAGRYDRVRGERSPGTQAPTRDALMAAIRSASPEHLTAMLEYSERLECHTCIPLLERELLENDSARVRDSAAWWLRHRIFGFGAVFHNMRTVLATDADPVRRARAADALGVFRDVNAIPYLRAALSDSDATVRVSAVRGLGELNSPAANDAIALAFVDADASVREAAAAQVTRVNFFRDFDGLIGLLADDAAGVRRRAALALGALRVADASPALAAMLSDTEARVRQAAAWALGRVGGADARSALTAQRELEETPNVRDAIEVALRML